MPEYGFSLTRILPYNGKIWVRENPYSGIIFCLSRIKLYNSFISVTSDYF